MATAVVFGHWGLRHSEPHLAMVEVKDVNAPDDDDGVSRVLDLRQFGADNLERHRVPLALAKIDGEAVQLSALLLRQDLHQVHLLRLPTLPSCTLSTLPETLDRVFRRNHLALNNFECCVFPLPAASPGALTLTLDVADITSVTKAAIARLDDGLWRGFRLKPGKPVQFVSGPVSVLQSLSGEFMHALRRGTMKKKRDPADQGWQMETFAAAAHGTWIRSEVREIPDVDLADFDQRPEIVAALHVEHPLASVATVHEAQTRIQVECCESGTVVELELAFRQVVAGADDAAAEAEGLALAPRVAIIRPCFSRLPELSPNLELDLQRLAESIAAMPGVRVAAASPSDAPSGFVTGKREVV